jgi:hypothetical protein
MGKKLSVQDIEDHRSAIPMTDNCENSKRHSAQRGNTQIEVGDGNFQKRAHICDISDSVIWNDK